MSSKWISNSVNQMSEDALRAVEQRFLVTPSFLSWDNVYISFRVFAQRLEKKTSAGCGTAATVFFKKDAPQRPLHMNKELRQQRVAGMRNPLTYLDIYDLAAKGFPDIERWMAYHVLELLLEAPEFDLPTYHGRKSPLLEPPPSVNLLLCGDDHITEQFMLSTLPIPEASYEDNDKVLHSLLDQVGIRTKQQRRDFGSSRVLFVVGDQLTVDRVRGLQRFRAQDLNATDRLDYVVPVWGWLHYEMAIAKSLHKQYFGSASGLGLKHAFHILERKGLDTTSTQGPFHDNLEDALYAILAARIRLSWLELAGVEDLTALRNRSPEDLIKIAEEIVHKHASVRRLNELNDLGGKKEHETLYHSVMFNRDVLLYVVLNQAIKRGDIGMMEHILPHMLLRFIGGKNSHYAGETLEILQGLHREWPAEIA
ncbi:hypothetical protein BN946_scf185002.g72 [Trametes cinnabarina]|uniref:DUF6589 domain-containing protein n=1 Tax=Pycnoporus cinnabarinus TaxID=5643 RepID=A0A060SEH2_PYCCI|nr:hypothetical protein BN946_scf185002.g72 [Trametes cinnabarina]